MAMIHLKQSKILRGGAESNYPLSEETSVVRFESEDVARRPPYFSFKISSKGGGYTVIRLEISLSDWQTIFEGLVSDNSELTGGFLEIAGIALQKELEGRKLKDRLEDK
jgi:hypothetical protein